MPLSSTASFPSVLIVDDDPDALLVLGGLLTALGAERVCAVNSAEEALSVLQRESFSAILCDYQLTGMTGVQFLERLRNSGDRTPMLLLSGAPEQKDVLRAARYEQVDFFPKPFRIAELRQSLARLASAA